MTDLTADPRETKLPRWAQDELFDLRRRLAEATEKLEGIDREGAVVFADPYSKHPVPVAQMNQSVQFRLDEKDLDWVSVYVRDTKAEGRHLQIMGARRLRIIPEASNAVLLGLL